MCVCALVTDTHTRAHVQTIMRLGDYTPQHALFFLSGLPTRCDANEDLVEAAMEPRFTDRYAVALSALRVSACVRVC